VTVASSPIGDAARITVDDDGPGLDPSLRDRVLQRGVRADEAAPGSGLGLAIVADLAELYGGSIALEESPAHGVRAILTLPRCWSHWRAGILPAPVGRAGGMHPTSLPPEAGRMPALQKERGGAFLHRRMPALQGVEVASIIDPATSSEESNCTF
jgi:hypothetical protein